MLFAVAAAGAVVFWVGGCEAFEAGVGVEERAAG
jgi:hypothetical protein